MHEVRPGQSIELLKELHILTRDGKMNQDSRRKLKQIFHLMQFIEPLLQEIRQSCPDIQLVDHGAGKSYLGFILYDLFFKTTSPGGHVFSIERRMELVERSRALAERLDSVVTRYGATRRDSEFAQQQGMTKAVSCNA